MNIDMSLPCTYIADLLGELSSDPTIYYPNANLHGGADGLIVRVLPFRGEAWQGVFEFGKISPYGVSGVFPMPNPNRVCIVAKGAGYIVSSDNPYDWEEVLSMPILDVRIALVQNLIIFVNYTEIVAYDQSGFKWRSERISLDGVQITELGDSYLRGQFWDDRRDKFSMFELNLESGEQNPIHN